MPRVTPGQQFRISSLLWNHRDAQIDRATFALRLPDGWATQLFEAETLRHVSEATSGQTLDETTPHPSAVYDVTASETAELACPYWLLKPRGLYR